MRDAFNSWWDADELMQTNPYNEDTPVWWAWEGWTASEKYKPDCNNCKNRGHIYVLSQELYCDHCRYQEKWRKDHYVAS